MFTRDKLPYRQSTLAIVINDKNEYLIVNKLSYEPDKMWAFPGGGIDGQESPEEAVLRELREELLSDKFSIVGRSKHGYQYEWADEVVEDVFKRKGVYYRGTQLIQYLVRFAGEDFEVRAGDGIRTVKWVTEEELKNYLIFPNQFEKAEEVIQEFRDKI